MTTMQRYRLGDSFIGQRDLPNFLNFYSVDICRGACDLRLLRDLTPCRLDELPIRISWPALPARFQAASQLEAGKDMRFCINDYRAQW
jgi:hypothetical protein